MSTRIPFVRSPGFVTIGEGLSLAATLLAPDVGAMGARRRRRRPRRTGLRRLLGGAVSDTRADAADAPAPAAPGLEPGDLPRSVAGPLAAVARQPGRLVVPGRQCRRRACADGRSTSAGSSAPGSGRWWPPCCVGVRGRVVAILSGAAWARWASSWGSLAFLPGYYVLDAALVLEPRDLRWRRHRRRLRPQLVAHAGRRAAGLRLGPGGRAGWACWSAVGTGLLGVILGERQPVAQAISGTVETAFSAFSVVVTAILYESQRVRDIRVAAGRRIRPTRAPPTPGWASGPPPWGDAPPAEPPARSARPAAPAAAAGGPLAELAPSVWRGRVRRAAAIWRASGRREHAAQQRDAVARAGDDLGRAGARDRCAPRAERHRRPGRRATSPARTGTSSGLGVRRRPSARRGRRGRGRALRAG